MGAAKRACARATVARAAFGILLLACGCLQLETHVRLNPDGSGTVTERLWYSARLLDLASKEGKGLEIASLLTKEAAVERMKHMGKGVELVSHSVRDVGGGRESVVVFKAADLGEFQYVSPFLTNAGYPHRVRFHVGPVLADRYTGEHAGQMCVYAAAQVIPQSKPVPRPDPKAPPPRGPTPGELQAFRELAPVFRDMMKDFSVRLSFECYAPIRVREGYRDSRAGTRTTDLLYFSDKQMDKYGYAFLENEELMVRLLRWDLGSGTVSDHLKGWTEDPLLPVLRGSCAVWFQPSEALFKKHLEGKTLTFTPPGRTVTRVASFDLDGYKEPK